MHETVSLLHCEQMSMQYLRANQTRVKQKLRPRLRQSSSQLMSQLEKHVSLL